MDDAPPPPPPAGALAVFLAFLHQGLTAFGGPVAHLAYFRREFVERRRWLSEGEYAELLALCHFLPGPASSQLGMAIGLRQAGLAGALAAFAGFTLPAGAAMIAFAYLAPGLSDLWGDAWLKGLKVAAAAVVIQALLAMTRTLARGPITAGLAVGAAAGLILAPGPGAQLAALAAGAGFGALLLRRAGPEPAGAPPVEVDRGTGLVALGLFAALLVVLPGLAYLLDNRGLELAAVFYRTGALVFGGGHVVLPLLESEVVAPGWLGRDAFLAGYGAVQALPGPLFSFAGYVGAAQGHGPDGWVGGLIALGAIFLPSLLLVVGVMPFWEGLKARAWARGAVAGAGAVVVGLLAAALWDPVLTSAVRSPADAALVAAAFVFLTVARLPPWLVVTGFAAAAGLVLP